MLSRDQFVGLENIVHLSAGGESPMLKSHEGVYRQFALDKGQGELARSLQADVLAKTRQQCADMFSVTAADVAFTSTASEGINIVTYGLDWCAGDNVVVCDVEFASGVYPWTVLQQQGVEIRIVRHTDWFIDVDDIAQLIDDRTRVVLVSHVSMFTGQRIDLQALSSIVRQSNARLLLDATHAAGVVPVDAALADVVVSSCYKWLLGVHGVSVFYWNRERFPELRTPFLGWNSAASAGGWEDPLRFNLHEDAQRFIPGNPSFISLYILANALDTLLPLGLDHIESHALKLTERLWHGIDALDSWQIMTPQNASDRAGNICIMSDRVEEVTAALRAQNILVWGTYAGDPRIRISCHLYNTEDDVDACLHGLSCL